MAADVWYWLKWFIAGLGGLVGALIGNLDYTVYGLAVCCLIDYVTGVLLAGFRHELSSSIGFKGILKKAGIFCLVCLGHLVDTVIIKEGAVFRSAMIFFYIGNEGLSILENCVGMGLPVPNKLRVILQQLKEEKTNGDNERD